jgi:hypothetical protein
MIKLIKDKITLKRVPKKDLTIYLKIKTYLGNTIPCIECNFYQDI